MTALPPRLLLDLDGRAACARVHPAEPGAPSGVPPVVLLAGGSGQGVDGAWGPDLEALLAHETTVLTYDRAGSGRSDGPQHGTVAGMADDLDELITAAGLRPPVVLVGWSLGAFVAQAHALRHPEHVAGLVFVDPTPAEPPPDTPAVRVQLATVGPQLRVFALASRAGAFSGRLGERLARGMAGPDAGPTTTAIALGLMRSPAALRALAVTVARQARYADEVRAALEAADLPGVPAVVSSAARRGGVPAAYVTSIGESHRRLVSHFPRGRLVVAENASHQVPYDDPGVIVDAVRAVLAEA